MVEATRPEVTRRRVLAATAGVGALPGGLGGVDEGAGPSGAELAADYDVPFLGVADGDVTLEVYEDFACPHCRTYNEELFPDLETAYLESEPVRYEHRNLPIPVKDPESWEAASAARAVFERGGNEDFWAYETALFEHQDQLGADTPALYGDLAADLGLDGGAVQSAAVDRAHDDVVGADRQRGVDAGVESTPSFVIDGEVVAAGSGQSALNDVEAALDAALGAGDD